MAGITRGARAVWQGSGKEGAGVLTTDSGTLANTAYSFAKRFADEKGTNPEELIAAAHAGCFAMALSFALGNAGFTPTALDATAKVTIAPVEGGFAISGSALTLKATARVGAGVAFGRLRFPPHGPCVPPHPAPLPPRGERERCYESSRGAPSPVCGRGTG